MSCGYLLRVYKQQENEAKTNTLGNAQDLLGDNFKQRGEKLQQ